MRTYRKTKFIHEGQYAAEIEVDVIQDETAFSPYLSLDDARRMDFVRGALRRGDLQAAGSEAKVYVLQPIAATA
jgi:hypothetical protein